MMPTATRLTPERAAELLASHAAMVWKIANNLHAKNRSLELDDIHSAVQLGFVRAASKFDPSKGLEFSTYAYPAGWREGVTFCMAEQARGFHVPGNHPYWKCRGLVSFDPKIDFEERNNGPVEPEFPKDFWKRMTSRLMVRERRIVLGVFRDGMQQLDLARELGVSKQRVNELHLRALKKIKKRSKRLRAYLEAA